MFHVPMSYSSNLWFISLINILECVTSKSKENRDHEDSISNHTQLTLNLHSVYTRFTLSLLSVYTQGVLCLLSDVDNTPHIAITR